MQFHFTPKWAGTFMYALIVEAVKLERIKKHMWNSPTSPNFELPLSGASSGDHSSMEPMTNVNSSLGSSPFLLPPTTCLSECSQFCIEHHLRTLCGVPRKPFSLCLIWGIYITKEDNSSYVKWTPVSLLILSKNHPLPSPSPLANFKEAAEFRLILLSLHMNDALTIYVPVNESGRNAYSLAPTGSTTWFEINGCFISH